MSRWVLPVVHRVRKDFGLPLGDAMALVRQTIVSTTWDEQSLPRAMAGLKLINMAFKEL